MTICRVCIYAFCYGLALSTSIVVCLFKCRGFLYERGNSTDINRT